MKYNIALLPQAKNQETIQLANQFASIADTYILGPMSLPHLTLSHFFAEEHELQRIWDETCHAISIQPMQLSFPKFSYKTFNNNIYWISLLPNQFAELKTLHLRIAEIVKHPVSHAYDAYDPHMTLINTKNNSAEELIRQVEKNYQAITDEFVLSLGKTDEVGQFIEIIKLSKN